MSLSAARSAGCRSAFPKSIGAATSPISPNCSINCRNDRHSRTPYHSNLLTGVERRIDAWRSNLLSLHPSRERCLKVIALILILVNAMLELRPHNHRQLFPDLLLHARSFEFGM